MPHGSRIRADPGWAIGTTWTSAEGTALDSALVLAVNGDGGGSYTLSGASDITIAGAGLRLFATPHVLSVSPSSITTNGTTKLLTNNDSDYCELGSGHAGASVTITTPITEASPPAGWTYANRLNTFPYPALAMGATAVVVPWAAFSVLGMRGLTGRVTGGGSLLVLPLRVHDGATLSQAVFSLAITGSASVVPARLPRFGIFAVDSFGNASPLATATSGYQSLPSSQWTAATRYHWGTYAYQTFTFTCDSASSNPFVVIDKSRYTYEARIIDASDPNAFLAAAIDPISGGTIDVNAVTYGDVDVTFTNIPDIRPR
jgi:hypothetical protein